MHIKAVVTNRFPDLMILFNYLIEKVEKSETWLYLITPLCFEKWM